MQPVGVLPGPVGCHAPRPRLRPQVGALADIRLVPRSCGLELFHNDPPPESRIISILLPESGQPRWREGYNILNPNSFASKLGGLMRWVWFRVAAAIVASSGIVAGLLVNIDRATREGQVRGDVLANYFSLFTIVSSILSVVAADDRGAMGAAAPRPFA